MVTGLFGFETGVKDDEMVDAFVNILMDGVRARKSKAGVSKAGVSKVRTSKTGKSK
jgi:hypothetical protein